MLYNGSVHVYFTLDTLNLLTCIILRLQMMLYWVVLLLHIHSCWEGVSTHVFLLIFHTQEVTNKH